MRKAGVSYTLIPLAILVIGIAFLANHSTTYAALTFNPVYASELCDDLADDTDITNSSCVGSPGENKTADAATETTTHTSWTTPDSNFTFLANTSPPDAVIAPGAAHAIGADMGIIRNLIKLGLGNSVCDNTPTVDFFFQNATTDITDTTSSWPEGFSDRHGILMMEDSTDDDGDGIYSEDGAFGEQSFASGLPDDYYTNGDDDGDTLVNEDPPDNANGGLPNHVAYYPRWLNDIFDPDLDGLKLDPAANGPHPPLIPYARYSSASLVVGVPVILQFVQFAPGQLTGFPDGNNFNELTTDMGWVNQIILNDTSEVVSAPSSISAFCETESHTRLFGTVNSVDRYNNPPAGTGLVDPVSGNGTNTHITWLYSHSGRDLDGDGIANADTYDTCATVDNPGWDPSAARPQSMDTDSDGIPEIDDVSPSGIGPEDSCDNAIITFPVQIDHESTPESNCTDNVDDDKDGRVNDNCPRVGGVGDEELNQCDNNTDDDLADGGENHAANSGIGWVNDGCAVVQGAGESGTECENDVDDDFDFRVNDGCPAVGAAEVQQCNEPEGSAVDDDSDGTINDGCFLDFLLVQAAGDLFLNGDDNCPILYNPLQTQGENSQPWAYATGFFADSGEDLAIALTNVQTNVDVTDGTTFAIGDFIRVDDEVMEVTNIAGNTLTVVRGAKGTATATHLIATDVFVHSGAKGGPRNDSMGDECDPQPNIADGPYLASAEINAVCITPGVDTDDDGFCDATEDALGSCKDDPCGGSFPGTVDNNGDTSVDSADSTPEHDMVEPPFPLARDGALGGVPTACSDGVDNDNDGTVDDSGAGCGSAGDGDQDGLADASDDNCPGNDGLALDDPVNVAAYNPTQTDSDGDSLGDACDDDMDADGRTQEHERWTGHDVMADCPVNTSHDAWPFDTNNSGNVNLVDLVGSPSFKGSFGTSQGNPAYFRQFDFNASGNVNLVDLVGTPGSFKNAFGTAC